MRLFENIEYKQNHRTRWDFFTDLHPLPQFAAQLLDNRGEDGEYLDQEIGRILWWGRFNYYYRPRLLKPWWVVRRAAMAVYRCVFRRQDAAEIKRAATKQACLDRVAKDALEASGIEGFYKREDIDKSVPTL